MQVQFTGCRIEKMEQYNGKFYTIVGVPAPDSFSHPSKYRLQSAQQIGQYGQLIDVSCNMQGIVKNKTFTDRQTNQQKSFDESTVLFDVVSVHPHVHPQVQTPAPLAQQTALPEGVRVTK